MWPIVSYALGLAAAITAAGLTAYRFRANGQILRCMAAVTVNWLLGIAFNFGTGITDGWWFNICIDFAAGVAILIRPAGRTQSILGLTYCVQIIMHISYGARLVFGAEADAWEYYNQLTAVAWLQLLIVGGWCGGIWWRNLYWTGRARGALPSGEGAQNLDEAG